MSQFSPKITWLHYFEYFGVRLLRFLLLVLPVNVGVTMSAKVWRYAGLFNHRHKRAIRHISWALDNPETSSKVASQTADMWENLGRTFAETLILDRLTKDVSRFSSPAQSDFDGWKAETKGAIIVTHHYGNWELAGALALSLNQKRVMGLYRRLTNPLVEAFLKSLRSTIYRGGLYSVQEKGVFHGADYLRAGGDIALVADLSVNNGIVVNFFNMPMTVSLLPAVLARRMGKPLYVAQMRRLKGGKFELDMKKIIVPETPAPEEDMRSVMQAVFKQFETWVREDPSQFMWAPYRWTRSLTKPEEFNPGENSISAAE